MRCLRFWLSRTKTLPFSTHVSSTLPCFITLRAACFSSFLLPISCSSTQIVLEYLEGMVIFSGNGAWSKTVSTEFQIAWYIPLIAAKAMFCQHKVRLESRYKPAETLQSLHGKVLESVLPGQDLSSGSKSMFHKYHNNWTRSAGSPESNKIRYIHLGLGLRSYNQNFHPRNALKDRFGCFKNL